MSLGWIDGWLDGWINEGMMTGGSW